MSNSRPTIHVISLFMVDGTLWLFDGVSVGSYENFSTDVNPGDMIIWQCPEHSGILSFSGIVNFDTEIFCGYPQPIAGFSNAFEATISRSANALADDDGTSYSVLLDDIPFDPKIRVVPSPSSVAHSTTEKNYSSLAAN